MKPNENGTDRAIRTIVGIVLLAGALMAPVATGGKIGMGVVGLVALTTATLGFCPLYKILGISTCAAVHHKR